MQQKFKTSCSIVVLSNLGVLIVNENGFRMVKFKNERGVFPELLFYSCNELLNGGYFPLCEP